MQRQDKLGIAEISRKLGKCPVRFRRFALKYVQMFKYCGVVRKRWAGFESGSDATAGVVHDEAEWPR